MNKHTNLDEEIIEYKNNNKVLVTISVIILGAFLILIAGLLSQVVNLVK